MAKQTRIKHSNQTTSNIGANNHDRKSRFFEINHKTCRRNDGIIIFISDNSLVDQLIQTA